MIFNLSENNGFVAKIINKVLINIYTNLVSFNHLSL